MYTEYDKLPGESRVWIYQSNRIFNQQEITLIETNIVPFLNQWQRHGEPLKASYKIAYDMFLILVVDQTEISVSGCSIDASVRFIKKLERELNLVLTDKLSVAYRNGKNLVSKSLTNFKKAIENAEFNDNVIVFNNMVITKNEFETKWEVCAKESWHKRLF